MMVALVNLASLFLVLMTSEGSLGSPLALAIPSCPAAIADQWDNLTKWDGDNLKLTLDIKGMNCSLDRKAEVEIFAVKSHDLSFECEHFEDSNDGYNNAKFWDGRDNSVYILSENNPKITFKFISGRFVFRIGNKKKPKYCTGIKSYSKGIEAAENNSALYYREKCLTTKEAEIAPRQPSWTKHICSLEIPTFQLPRCYLITNYTTAPVYLIQVDDKNKTCSERGKAWELNPVIKTFNFEFHKKIMQINEDTQIKDIRFTNLEEEKQYCIFISMWETYPICNSAFVDDPDLCYFFSPTAFKCPPKPPAYEKQIQKASSPIISIGVSSSGIILVVCAFLVAKLKRKMQVKLKTNTVVPLPSASPKDEEERNSKIYLLYYPNDEVTEEDIKQVIDENGSLCKNLINICSTDINVTIVDIVEKIRLDEIQDTSVIEMDLSSGVAKCVLILTPSAKKLLDHIASGGNTPNPLDRDFVDGSVRNVILPLFKHIINIQNINMNTYQTIGCVRFDRNDSNDGDEIQINPLVRMSLPSDGREFAEWAIHNS